MLESIPREALSLLFLSLIWTVPLKGWALWRAAQRKEAWWFIALLLINTLGILEAIYLLVTRKQKNLSHQA